MTDFEKNKKIKIDSEIQTNFQLSICKLCSGSNIDKLNLGGTELIICSDCGIVYNSSFKSIQELQKYYQ